MRNLLATQLGFIHVRRVSPWGIGALLLSALCSVHGEITHTYYVSQNGSGTKDGSSSGNAAMVSGAEAPQKDLQGLIDDGNASVEILITGNLTLTEQIAVGKTVTIKSSVDGTKRTITCSAVDPDDDDVVAFKVTAAATFQYLTFTGAKAGAVEAKGGTFKNCTFSGNDSANGNGGAINVTGGTVNVDWCTFSSNTARDRGGAIYNEGTLTANHSTFTSNSASIYFGGAISNEGTLYLYNSELKSNSAKGGGAVYNNKTATIRNCDIKSNSATETTVNGGGIYAASSYSLQNSIVRSNSPDQIAGTTPTITTSNIQGGYDDGKGINYDLGSTATVNVNAGNSGYWTNQTESALHGTSEDMKRVAGDDVDIGAYESENELYKPYDLAWSVSPEGAATKGGTNYEDGEYRETTSITLTPVAAPGNTFEKWTGGTIPAATQGGLAQADDKFPLTFPIYGNINLIANYVAKTYNIYVREDLAATIEEPGTAPEAGPWQYDRTFGNLDDDAGINDTIQADLSSEASETNATITVDLKGEYELEGWVSGSDEADANASRDAFLVEWDSYLAAKKDDDLDNDLPQPTAPIQPNVDGEQGSLSRAYGQFDFDNAGADYLAEYLIPILRLKTYEVTAKSNHQPFVDLGLEVETNGTVLLDASSEPVGTKPNESVKLMWTPPPGGQVDSIEIGNEAKGFKTVETWAADWNSSFTNFSKYKEDGYLHFSIDGDMPGPELKIKVIFRPISYKVDVVRVYEISEQDETDMNTTLPKVPSGYPGGNIGSEKFPLFEGGSSVEIGWTEAPDLMDQVEVFFESSTRTFTSSGPDKPFIISDLDQDEEVTVTFRLKSVTLTHRIYQGADTDSPYFESRTSYFVGQTTFAPVFDGQTGYEIIGDPVITRNATGILVTPGQTIVSGDDSYRPFEMSADTTIVSFVKPITYLLTTKVEFQANDVDDPTPDDNGTEVGTVTLSILPLGSTPIGDGATEYAFAFDSNVTVSAEVAVTDSGSGYQFSHWKGDTGDDVPEKDIYVSEDVSLTAVFTRKKHAVTFDDLYGSGNVIIGASRYGVGSPASVEHGSSITITADPAPGYRVSGKLTASLASSPESIWVVGTGSLITLTVTEPVIVGGTFEEDRDTDTDGDGLSHYVESLYGTSDTDMDSDDDQMPDFWEVIDWRLITEAKDENGSFVYDDAFWLDTKADLSLVSLRENIDEIRYDPANPPEFHLDPTSAKYGDRNESEVDFDFDEVDNLTEYLSRSNPFDPDTMTNVIDEEAIIETGVLTGDFFKVVFSVSPLASAGTLNYQGPREFKSGQEVFVQVTQTQPGWSFRQWEAGLTGFETNGTITVTGDMNVTARFKEDEGDDDEDGLTNYEEIVIHGTDSNNSDTDGDGIRDDVELEKQEEIEAYNVSGLFEPTVSDTAFFELLSELDLSSPTIGGSSSGGSSSGGSSSGGSSSGGSSSYDANLLYDYIDGWFYVDKEESWFFAPSNSYSVYSSDDETWLAFQKGTDDLLDTFQWDFANKQWVLQDSAPVEGRFKLTVTKNLNEGGEVSSDGTFAEGKTITITAAPSAGYHFVGWKWDDNTVSTNATETFEISRDVSVQAVFLSKGGLSSSLDGAPGN